MFMSHNLVLIFAPSVPARRVLHHHSVVPVEGDRHHAGELSAPLHPQVPPQTLLPAQLLQADLLKTLASFAFGKTNRGAPVVLQQRIKPGFILPFFLISLKKFHLETWSTDRLFTDLRWKSVWLPTHVWCKDSWFLYGGNTCREMQLV